MSVVINGQNVNITKYSCALVAYCYNHGVRRFDNAYSQTVLNLMLAGF